MPTDNRAIEPCFGVGCPHHLTCARYEAVNGCSQPISLGYCFDGKSYPKYIPLIPNDQSLLF